MTRGWGSEAPALGHGAHPPRSPRAGGGRGGAARLSGPVATGPHHPGGIGSPARADHPHRSPRAPTLQPRPRPNRADRRGAMKPGDIHGVVALVLATGVAVTVVILSLETVLHTGPISQAEATVLATIVGAIIGAVAAYLGVSKAGGSGGGGSAGGGGGTRGGGGRR